MSKDRFNQECESRLLQAKEIVHNCPTKYGKEIFVVGSVSRNIADENSDTEIEFLVDSLIPKEDLINWIKEIGGTEICPYGKPLDDGSVWIIFKYNDSWIEAGWQTIHAMENNINSIIRDKETLHSKLILGSTIKDAFPIRDNGILKDMQNQLNFYPVELQKKIIRDTINPWNVDLAIEVRKTLSKREDIIPFLERMTADVKSVLRILYAINGQWEPDWKWTNFLIEKLTIKPKNLEDRIDSIICIKDTKENLKHCFELIKDTLLLIPEELELGIIIEEIKSKLDKVI